MVKSLQPGQVEQALVGFKDFKFETLQCLYKSEDHLDYNIVAELTTDDKNHMTNCLICMNLSSIRRKALAPCTQLRKRTPSATSGAETDREHHRLQLRDRWSLCTPSVATSSTSLARKAKGCLAFRWLRTSPSLLSTQLYDVTTLFTLFQHHNGETKEHLANPVDRQSAWGRHSGLGYCYSVARGGRWRQCGQAIKLIHPKPPSLAIPNQDASPEASEVKDPAPQQSSSLSLCCWAGSVQEVYQNFFRWKQLPAAAGNTETEPDRKCQKCSALCSAAVHFVDNASVLLLM